MRFFKLDLDHFQVDIKTPETMQNPQLINGDPHTVVSIRFLTKVLPQLLLLPPPSGEINITSLQGTSLSTSSRCHGNHSLAHNLSVLPLYRCRNA